jgi:hypothetical protein
MKNPGMYVFVLTILVSALFSCLSNTNEALDMDNYFAWCIVPFDNQNRTSEQRLAMLHELGFQSYAYDWRQKHLPEMAHELDLAKKYNIGITAIWMWIDATDSVGALSPENEQIFKIIEETGTKTQLWLGISEAWLGGLPDDSCMVKSGAMISYLSKRAAPLGCNIGLYNHGGWFGDPVNQVRLIEKMPSLDLGIIFNFHHAHDMIDDFPVLVDKMMPYLWAVNLNGMRQEGPKILPIGDGDKEKTMIDVLEDRGFHGPYGILGHVEDADVKIVLERNIEGLKSIM